MTPQLSRHLGAGNTLSIEVLTEIQHDTSLNMKSTERNTFLNTLHRSGDFSQYPHLEARKGKFLALKISHFETQITNQIVVKEGGCWRREIWGHQAGERTTLHDKYELLFIVSIFVKHCRI